MILIKRVSVCDRPVDNFAKHDKSMQADKHVFKYSQRPSGECSTGVFAEAQQQSGCLNSERRHHMEVSPPCVQLLSSDMYLIWMCALSLCLLIDQVEMVSVVTSRIKRLFGDDHKGCSVYLSQYTNAFVETLFWTAILENWFCHGTQICMKMTSYGES